MSCIYNALPRSGSAAGRCTHIWELLWPAIQPAPLCLPLHNPAASFAFARPSWHGSTMHTTGRGIPPAEQITVYQVKGPCQLQGCYTHKHLARMALATCRNQLITPKAESSFASPKLCVCGCKQVLARCDNMPALTWDLPKATVKVAASCHVLGSCRDVQLAQLAQQGAAVQSTVREPADILVSVNANMT